MNIVLLLNMICIYRPENVSVFIAIFNITDWCPDVPDELLPGPSLPGRPADGPADPPAGDRLEPHQSPLLGRPARL